ncbi:hypothetical protein DID88_007621 [Monilinia fructigena]|uniref:Uncharacterized protein n=1 Tax=Monilinia fructigena TaxID=38457 RepID=A0A395J3Y2_9HELO|nr:hypothetical protein DID88_007621 [Monilinia fructigena]
MEKPVPNGASWISILLKSDDRFAVPARPSTSRSSSRPPSKFQSRSNNGSATPRYTPSARSKPKQEEFDGPEPLVDEEDSKALDRDWYAGDEMGHTFGDDSHNPFGSYDNSWAENNNEKQH